MSEASLGINPEIPPNDFETEKYLLSSMVFDEVGIAVGFDLIKKDDFYRPEHRVIFDSLENMFLKDTPVDIITLKNALETSDTLQLAGGYDYLLELFNLVSTSASTRYYAEIIKEKSTRRKILQASKEIRSLTFDNSDSVENLVLKAEKIVSEISSTEISQDVYRISEILGPAIERIEELYKNKNKVTGLETGFVDFDAKTAGLQNSDLILIAARPSMGKTAFVINIAQHIALKHDISTLIFSLEMSKEQLMYRMLCSEALIDSNNLRTGNFQNDDWYKIAEAVAPLSSAPIFVDDRAGISIAEIRSKCRKLKKDENLGLVIIDYLQLMNSGRKSENRQQEISTISRELKGLARELNIPIIALSQLSRAVEQRKPPKPMLSDLRESGAIEQDADLVCFLYREEYYNPETEKRGQAELIIAKQRNGSVGSIDLSWLGQYTKFSNFERSYSDY